MSQIVFRTAVTELSGTRLPIVARKFGRDVCVTVDGAKGLLAAGQPLVCVGCLEPLAGSGRRFESDMRRAFARLAIR